MTPWDPKRYARELQGDFSEVDAHIARTARRGVFFLLILVSLLALLALITHA